MARKIIDWLAGVAIAALILALMANVVLAAGPRVLQSSDGGVRLSLYDEKCSVKALIEATKPEYRPRLRAASFVSPRTVLQGCYVEIPVNGVPHAFVILETGEAEAFPSSAFTRAGSKMGYF